MKTRLKLHVLQSIFAYTFIHFLTASQDVKGQVTPIIDSLLQVLEKQDPDIVEVELLCEIAMQYTEVDPVQGLVYARQAKDIALHRGVDLDLARANNAVAANWLMLMEMDSAIRYFDEALVLYNKLGNTKGMGDISGNKGHAAYHIGRFDEALKYYFESLTYYEEVGFKQGIINQHASLGNTYMVQEKTEQAIYHDSIALEGFAALGDSLGYAMVLGNLANIYNKNANNSKALAYFREAADILKRHNQPLGMGRNLGNLAALYIDEGQYLQALEAAQEGFKICSENNIGYCTQYCLSNMGLAYLKSYTHQDSNHQKFILVPGPPSELLANAIRYLKEAVVLSENFDAPQEFEEVHRALAQAYKYNGDFENALKHHEIFASLKDSLASVERAERIEQLTTDREIAVRDKQIELDKLTLKVKRNERIYFIIGLGLLAGWLLFVYRNALNQRKSNQQLNLLNGQITTANLQLEDRNDQLSLTLDELKSTQAQLIESERQKENEILRRRISRDIHDDISSGLSKISWMTEVLSKNTDVEDKGDADMLQRIASYSRETVSKLGEIIWSTKPESDNFAGLVAYCREFLSKYLDGLPIRTHIDLPVSDSNAPMNPELRRNLYLVLKEAVHNAVKYSKATDLKVSMQVQNGAYHLEIEDNGIGMDIQNGSSNGNGFRNMEGRMKDVNGSMSVASSPGKGMRIEFTGPVY